MMLDMKKTTLEFTSIAVANDLVMVQTPAGYSQLVHNPLEANALRLLASKGLLLQTTLVIDEFAESA